MGGSDREELKKYPPSSPAVLSIVNVCERKPKQKKTTIEEIVNWISSLNESETVGPNNLPAKNFKTIKEWYFTPSAYYF